MLRWIAALLLIPFFDAVLLVIIVTQTDIFGWVSLVAFVVLTGLIGLLLVRAEGRRTLGKIQRSLYQDIPPTDALLDGAFLLIAGALLLTPGILTDIIGLLIVFPLSRILIRNGVKRWVLIPYLDEKSGGFASGTVWTYGFPDDQAVGDTITVDSQGPTDGDDHSAGQTKTNRSNEWKEPDETDSRERNA